MTATPTPLREALRRIAMGEEPAQRIADDALAATRAALSARDEAGAVGEVRIENGCIVSTSIKRPLADGGYDVVPQVATPPASGEVGADDDLAARVEELENELQEARETVAEEYERDAGAALRGLMKLIGHEWDEPLTAFQQAGAIAECIHDHRRRLAAVAPAGMDGRAALLQQIVREMRNEADTADNQHNVSARSVQYWAERIAAIAAPTPPATAGKE